MTLAPRAGKIISATGYRLPRTDINRPEDRFAAGFGLRIVVETTDGAAPGAGVLGLAAQDSRGTWALPTPLLTPAKPVHVIWPVPPTAVN